MIGEDRMPRQFRRRSQCGQSLVIFALIAVVLFAVIGLAVDGGFSYFASDRLERGAIAAALAGVPDMPDYSTAPNDAQSTAIAAAAKNGWTIGGANNVAVVVSKVTDPNTGLPYNNRLQVTVTSDVPVFFMKLLGFGVHREARTAVAEYLRPITFGQPGSQLGSAADSLGSGNNYYFLRSEGWGTDRGQGDAYGPNPSNAWTGVPSSPNIDVHALNGASETASQPLATMPARGGYNYQVFIPNGQHGVVQVYNPVFAPDNSLTGANGYNYHEDDGDFPETGSGCTGGGSQGTAPCAGPSNLQQWPTMSYTLYQSGNPFDHTTDTWFSNMLVKSIDATAATSSPATYTIPKNPVSATTHLLSGLTLHHNWIDVASLTPPAGANPSLTVQDKALVTLTNPTATDIITSASANGTTYRLRVDQLDSSTNPPGDPGSDGRPQNQNSQAHKGYSVRVQGVGGGCSGCSVTALNDVTLYTPVKAGGFTMPLVSIPPEYEGHDFSLYIYDPGDVTCNVNGCSNILSVLQPNGVTATTTNPNGAVYSTGSGEGDAANPATWSQVAPVSAQDSIQTQNQAANPPNIYNGKWIQFYISVPANYHTIINPALPSTWFWSLQYSTSQAAGDTITANLGFTGAPVHLISG
jgi:hypothetical protein